MAVNAVIVWQRFAAVAALALLVVVASSPASAQVKKPKAGVAVSSTTTTAAAPAVATTVDYGERFRTVCAACHGVNGRSDLPGMPVLAGQHSFYAITQLFLFREGRRNNEAMIALAKPMKDADLRGFADYIGTLAPVPVPPPAAPPDMARMSKGLALAQQHKCLFCHGADLAGGQQVPNIAGQKEDYLHQTLQGFKSGERPAYTRAMTEALSQVSVQELTELAYFVANFTAK